jgi:hypothetical protein
MSERALTVGGKNATRHIDDIRAKGVAAAYAKTDSGVKTLAALSPITRKVILVCKVTEVFDTGTGAQPTIKIGETSTDDKFAATSLFASATLGTVFTLAGEITANKALIATYTAATGTATGALSITAILASAL